MNVETRKKLEKQMARLFIKTMLGHGFCISVQDGEEWVVTKSTDRKAILDAMMSTDMDRLRVWDKNPEGTWQHLGTSLWVYGNDGWDVINDYHVSLEPYMTPITALSDRLASRYN